MTFGERRKGIFTYSQLIVTHFMFEFSGLKDRSRIDNLDHKRIKNERNCGPFLTAMTFDRIRVEHYMTKFSFLTAFFSVRLRAPKRLA